MNYNEPNNDHTESVDLLYYRRTKPLHGHIVADCYVPLSDAERFFETLDKPSSNYKTEPCIIETIPKSRVPVVLPDKPEKNHPTKGGSREEPEPLFAEFAGCDNLESILHFADKYGRLTTGSVGLPDESDPVKFQTVPGERVGLWEYEVNLMKLAIAFWMADSEFIRQRITFETDSNNNIRRVLYFTDWIGTENLTKRQLLAASKPDGFNSHIFEYLPEGDYTAAARTIAFAIVSRALRIRHHAHSNLIMKGTGEFALRIMPENLIAVIWHSFAEVMIGERIIKRCIVCGRLIEVHDTTSQMIFHKACRDRIKVKRSRCKEKYSALVKEGTPLPDVATACKVNLATLEYWLSLDKKQKGSDSE